MDLPAPDWFPPGSDRIPEQASGESSKQAGGSAARSVGSVYRNLLFSCLDRPPCLMKSKPIFYVNPRFISPHRPAWKTSR